MKNYLGDAEPLALVAPAGGVVSGIPVVIGAALVVPAVTAVEGRRFSAKRTGEFRLPKADGVVADQLSKAYWSVSDSEITSTASGNKLVGIFAAPAVNGHGTADVLLTGEII